MADTKHPGPPPGMHPQGQIPPVISGGQRPPRGK
jgi:hypothetical protein